MKLKSVEDLIKEFKPLFEVARRVYGASKNVIVSHYSGRKHFIHIVNDGLTALYFAAQGIQYLLVEALKHVREVAGDYTTTTILLIDYFLRHPHKDPLKALEEIKKNAPRLNPSFRFYVWQVLGFGYDTFRDILVDVYEKGGVPLPVRGTTTEDEVLYIDGFPLWGSIQPIDRRIRIEAVTLQPRYPYIIFNKNSHTFSPHYFTPQHFPIWLDDFSLVFAGEHHLLEDGRMVYLLEKPVEAHLIVDGLWVIDYDEPAKPQEIQERVESLDNIDSMQADYRKAVLSRSVAVLLLGGYSSHEIEDKLRYADDVIRAIHAFRHSNTFYLDLPYSLLWADIPDLVRLLWSNLGLTLPVSRVLEGYLYDLRQQKWKSFEEFPLSIPEKSLEIVFKTVHSFVSTLRETSIWLKR